MLSALQAERRHLANWPQYNLQFNMLKFNRPRYIKMHVLLTNKAICFCITSFALPKYPK